MLPKLDDLLDDKASIDYAAAHHACLDLIWVFEIEHLEQKWNAVEENVNGRLKAEVGVRINEECLIDFLQGNMLLNR